MHRRAVTWVVVALFVAAGAAVAPVSLAGQAQTNGQAFTPSRTPWGDPDLQGFWAIGSSALTPLERPEELADKEFITEEEAAERLRFSNTRRDRVLGTNDIGNYNDFWTPEEGKVSRRTSLIIDPPSGRVPPLTEAAQRRQSARGGRRGLPATWVDLGLWSRCITRQGAPMLPGPYNNNFHIMQGPGYVAIVSEVLDRRIIPLDGRPHVPQTVRQWLGDSRGRWEGNTLVVETTNFTDETNFRGSGEKLHLVERFTPVSADTMDYQFTVEDPETFTRPWTALMLVSRLEGETYEYACHEGNTSMTTSLSGARAEERATAAGSSSGGR